MEKQNKSGCYVESWNFKSNKCHCFSYFWFTEPEVLQYKTLHLLFFSGSVMLSRIEYLKISNKPKATEKDCHTYNIAYSC